MVGPPGPSWQVYLCVNTDANTDLRSVLCIAVSNAKLLTVVIGIEFPTLHSVIVVQCQSGYLNASGDVRHGEPSPHNTLLQLSVYPTGERHVGVGTKLCTSSP